MIGLRAATKLSVVLAITLLAAGAEGLRAQQRVQNANQAASENCVRSSFRVVVDVGHTADVPGAMSARGIPEYAFNLQLAREIKQALVDAGFEQATLLITATAPWRGLVERAARANSSLMRVVTRPTPNDDVPPAFRPRCLFRQRDSS